MPDVQDFDNFLGGTVHNNVRRADKFAGSSHLSRPPKAGKIGELFNPFNHALSDIPSSGRIVFLNVFNSHFKLVSRFGCPPNKPHERNSRSITVKHFLMCDKLATVRLLDASLHACDEAGLIFQHAGNSTFHELLGVLAIGRGHLLEPRFNVWREMYFHAFKVRENR